MRSHRKSGVIVPGEHGALMLIVVANIAVDLSADTRKRKGSGMERGYVKLWRRSFESVVFADERLWKLWCLCLMLAAHKNKTTLMADTYVGVKLLPGQFLIGRFALHKLYYPKPPKDGEIQVRPKTIWGWLQALARMEKISIESRSKGSVITINNWSHYQVTEQAITTSPAQDSAGLQGDSDTPTTSSPPADHQQSTTSKSHADKGFPEGHLPESGGDTTTNKKKEVKTTTTTKKNIKKKVDLTKMDFSEVSFEKIDSVIQEETVQNFILHRAAKKSPLTQNALELTCKTAMKCAEAYDMDPNEAINYAIQRGWQSFQVKWLEKDFSKALTIATTARSTIKMTPRQQYIHEATNAILELKNAHREDESNSDLEAGFGGNDVDDPSVP